MPFMVWSLYMSCMSGFLKAFETTLESKFIASWHENALRDLVAKTIQRTYKVVSTDTVTRVHG